jgi:hypothetical protein
MGADEAFVDICANLAVALVTSSTGAGVATNGVVAGRLRIAIVGRDALVHICA